ncbi:hypothetical protein AVEN_94990-1 [Araneus ventricosus]|uniref:Uncharacterized protein n=1 Tax=Araneus ventricosus TaxID=182803 RepID=A0A4Y2P0E2_ARAVE|nr:hypothetical protein AVEN_94990-1 [Araneus ventricosus]
MGKLGHQDWFVDMSTSARHFCSGNLVYNRMFNGDHSPKEGLISGIDVIVQGGFSPEGFSLPWVMRRQRRMTKVSLPFSPLLHDAPCLPADLPVSPAQTLLQLTNDCEPVTPFLLP